jgi:hypothetical protein
LAEIERHRTGDKRRRRRLSTVGRYAVVWRMIETEAIVIVIVDLNSFERERVSGESCVGRVIHCWFEQVTEEGLGVSSSFFLLYGFVEVENE